MVFACVDPILESHIGESGNLKMKTYQIDVCGLLWAVSSQCCEIHDTCIVFAAECDKKLIRDRDGEEMLIEELPERRYPCRGEVWDVYIGVFQQRFGDASFPLRVFDVEFQKFSGLASRVDGIAHILELGDAEFCTEVHKF
jgi:hypothetical protein